MSLTKISPVATILILSRLYKLVTIMSYSVHGNIALTISIHRMTDSIGDIEKLTILIYDVCKITKYHRNKQSPYGIYYIVSLDKSANRARLKWRLIENHMIKDII